MYTFTREDLDGFCSAIGGDTRERGNELEWKRCPYCDGGDHGDKWTFSVNTETGQFNCQRASCGKHGAFVQLAADFGYDLPDAKNQVYKDFSIGILGKLDSWVSTPESKKYLLSRGIPENVIDKYRITTYESHPKTIVFPFFDSKDNLQCIKYRNTTFSKPKSGETTKGMKEWFEANTRHILYGEWLCEQSGSLVVTEGQIDALSLASAGIKNVVSVPGGAKNFKWAENSRDFVEKFDEIIIFGDCENGKVTLVDGFCKNFPKMKIRVVRIKDYLKCKDANEILQAFQDGGDYENSYSILKQCIEQAEDARRLPIQRMGDIKWDYSDNQPKIKTGFAQLDKTIKGLSYGQLCILTGWSGDGKSNFASQLIVNVAHQSIKTLIYSGEMSNELVTEQISFIVAGSGRISEIIDTDGDVYRHFTDDNATKEAVSRWMLDYGIYLWEDQPISQDSTDSNETSFFINQLELVISTIGCKLVVLDNLMTLLTVNEDKDVYQAQTNLIKKLKTLARQYDIVIVLVAHPRKSPTSIRELTQDSISGSKDIVNLADMVLAYTRHNDETKTNYDRRLNILKNRRSGILLENNNGIYLMYDKISQRIAESKNGFVLDYLKGYAPPTAPEIDF